MPVFVCTIRATQSIVAAATIVCSVVAKSLAAEPVPVDLRAANHWHINHATHHVQGLAVSDESFWISSVEKAARQGWIFRVDRTSLKIVAQRALVDGARFHPGGMQRRGDSIWLPLAEYRPRSTTVVLELDAASLETKRSFTVQDHLGAIAVDDQGLLHGANWDARRYFVLSPERAAVGEDPVVRAAETRTGVAYQDWEWHDGRLWATGLWKSPDGPRAVVDVLDAREFALTHRYLLRGEVRSGGQNFAREGCCLWQGSLWLLPEDGPHTTVYEFPLPRP